jgi:hypothetical protein
MAATRAPPAATARQIQIAARIPAADPVPIAVTRYSKIGAARNAVTPRSSSTRANTRWICAERNENPVMNSAGDTDAPTPSPMSPDAAATSASWPPALGFRPVSSAAPAASMTRPPMASSGVNRVRNNAPNSTAVSSAAPNSGRNSTAVCAGLLFSCSAVRTSSISPNAAALAHMATPMPHAGSVVTSCLTGISGWLARYWWMTSATIIARPASSGASEPGAGPPCCSCAAPKNAAAQPRPASATATMSHGALRSCAGASW